MSQISEVPLRIKLTAIFFAVLFGVTALDYFLSGKGQEGIRFTVTEDGAVQLPHHWKIPLGGLSQREFDFTFDRTRVLSDSPFIYFPSFEQRMELTINGIPIVDDGLTGSWYGPITTASAYIEIPVELLKPGLNHLQLSLEVGPLIFGGLSPFILGDKESLWAVAKLRKFINLSLPQILFGMQLLVLVVAAVALSRDRGASSLAWLIVSNLPPLLFSSSFVTTYIQGFQESIRNFLVFAPITGLGLLALSYALTDSAQPIWLKRLLLLILCVALVALTLPQSLSRWVIFVFALPLFVVLMLAAAIRFYRIGNRQTNITYGLIALGIFIVVLSSTYDAIARAGLIENWSFLWTSTLRSVLIVGVAIHVFSQNFLRSEAERLANQRITAQLEDQERKLAQAHRRESVRQREVTIQEERNRILQDLHDGVAGQLVVMSTLLSKESVNREQIRSSCLSALADLRVVVNSLSVDSGDLAFALGMYRDKYLTPLESLGVEIEWNMEKLPALTGLTGSEVLNIVRLLQEAQNNALRHGEVKKLALSALLKDDKVEIRVENSGGQAFEPKQMGIGLNSIRQRSDLLHGTVDFEPTVSGMLLTICIPVNPCDRSNEVQLSRRSFKAGAGF